MVVAEPATVAELIADCAALPEAMQDPSVRLEYRRRPVVESPQHPASPAPSWAVGDDCARQVADMEEYGSS